MDGSDSEFLKSESYKLGLVNTHIAGILHYILFAPAIPL